jgi:predicted transcriptional regulator
VTRPRGLVHPADVKHSDFRRVRRFFELTQEQVSIGTGIPTGRIAAIEQGRVKPIPIQERILRSFLESRLRAALLDEESLKVAVDLLEEKQ